MDNDKIKLDVVGISRSQVAAGAYALLLEEPESARRIPIVVGVAEAQSIAVKLENVVTPRPLTHDLLTSVFHAFGIELESVLIDHFADGIFSSTLHLRQDGIETDLDARTSDAVALALRTGAPIYTTAEVLERTSYRRDPEAASGGKPRTPALEDLPVDRLQRRLEHYVEREQYERAAEIQKIIQSKTNSSKGAEESAGNS